MRENIPDLDLEPILNKRKYMPKLVKRSGTNGGAAYIFTHLQIMKFPLLYFILLANALCSQVQAQKKAPVFFSGKARQLQWADSVLSTMDTSQRIGQLFMVAAFSNKDKNHVQQIEKLITENHIGGLCFFQGGPLRQAKLCNNYQKLSKVPLLIGIDGEWGLAMRLDSTIRFPRQMTLGAIQNEKLIYQMGASVAQQCKRIGIQINLAPVADVNNNPLNPVIGNRSFGESKIDVARKAELYMRGMQDNGVLACVKHFPGHGDTDTDSHLSLPVIRHSKSTIDSLDLFPFKKLFDAGAASVMVAHLNIPSLDTVSRKPATLSKAIVDSLLINSLKYKGLIITDALNMKGISNYYKAGDIEVKALEAGNDILLYSEDVPLAIKTIYDSLKIGALSMDLINQKVKKILMAKYWAGLAQKPLISTNLLYEELNKPEDKWLNRQLWEQAITVLRNKKNLIPIKDADLYSMASLTIGDVADVPFNNMLQNYAAVNVLSMPATASQLWIDSIVNTAGKHKIVVVNIHNTSTKAEKNYGVTENILQVINRLKKTTHVILCTFGNPYVLSKIESANEVDVLIQSYEGTEDMQELVAQLIFGSAKGSGRLPVAAGKSFNRGEGMALNTGKRIRHTMPEELGLKSADFNEIEKIVKKGISQKAMPGCQVLVAKDGKVIYNQAFGNHTYDGAEKVKTTDIYDIASVTKVAATTLALMYLYDQNMLKLDSRLEKLSDRFKGYPTGKIVLRDLLSHQAGLPAFKNYWKSTMQGDSLSPEIFSKTQDEKHQIRIFGKTYLRNDYPDSIYADVLKLVPGEKKLLYSDFSFIIAKLLVEDISKQKIEDLLSEKFYKPLGLATLGFRPYENFAITKIPPTENDKLFRHTLVWGDVHDPTAALMGGIAGHAGLFSNSNDLATIFQMLLNKGNYNGRQYLKSSTIDEFTKATKPGKNRRGLGFDKPETAAGKPSPTSEEASAQTFGHQGFTGTCVWADPQYNLIYVFLSNRINPDAEPNKLSQLNIRTDIQKVIYKAIRK